MQAAAAGLFASEAAAALVALPPALLADYPVTLRTLPRDARPAFVRLCSTPLKAYVEAKTRSDATAQKKALIDLLLIPRKVLQSVELRFGERRVEQVQRAIIEAEWEVNGRDKAFDWGADGEQRVRRQVYAARAAEAAADGPSGSGDGAPVQVYGDSKVKEKSPAPKPKARARHVRS